MLIIRMNDGDPPPLGRPGFERVLVTEYSGHRHMCFIHAEFCELYRGHSDIVNAINYIRSQAPGLTMRKVEML